MLNTMEEIQLFFQKRKYLGIKLGLERMQYLLERLGNPEKKLRTIHVAGTNGKGSTIQFLQNVLINNDYKVGVFTSPSFTNLCGHFFINGKEIQEQDFISTFKKLLPFIKELDGIGNSPTEFEILTVLAIYHFRENVDIALFETGMGGRDDTTNVITPIVSVITNVSYDHSHFLGSTIEEITLHKAGIIKENRPVIVGNVHESSRKIISAEARKNNASLYLLNEHFSYRIFSNNIEWSYCDEFTVSFSLGFHGMYQIENISIVLMVIYYLNRHLGIKISWDKTIPSIERTKLIGRFEKINNDPPIILDSAHNVAGIKAFIQSVEEHYPKEEKHLLFAGFKDKELEEMLQSLKGHFKTISITTFDHERAATLTDMSEFIEKYHLTVVHDWQEEVLTMLNHSTRSNINFVTGSLHFIAQVRTFILEQMKKDYV